MNDYKPAGDRAAATAAPVHVVAVSAEAAAALSSKATSRSGPRCKGSYQTFVLTANDPVAEILPQDDNREYATIQAIDNDVVIGPKAAVQSSANTVTSVPQPQGTYLPKANTAPIMVKDYNAVFAGATTTATESRVAVAAFYRE